MGVELAPKRVFGVVLVLAWVSTISLACAEITRAEDSPGKSARVAVFNIWELGAEKVDRVDEQGLGAFPQLQSAARVIARVRPDILVLKEIDYHPGRNLPRIFLERYLDPLLHREGERPLPYPYLVYLPVNTGLPSGLDLDNDGRTDSPEDAWGFGRYPGQYGMAVLSRFPVQMKLVRTFRGLRWVTMPGHLMPDGREGRPAWYSADEAAVLRLSSKSHWDVPIDIHGRTVHLLVSHPTPPVFDSTEDRNGRRNHDEIRLWADYISVAADDQTTYLVDDQGRRGGLGDDQPFIIAGDLNADPYREGPLGPPSIEMLLKHPRVLDPRPSSEGELPNRRESSYPGDPRQRTSAYGRIDYLLPSRNLEISKAGVFVPPQDSPDRKLVEGDDRASDHLMVWLDLSPKGFP